MDGAAAVGEGVVALLFLGMGVWLAWQAHKAATRGVRVLASAAAATCAISTAAALQRMGDEAVQNGWLPHSVADVLWGPWEAVQILVSLAVLVWAATALARFWVPLGRAERMVHVLTGRLPDEIDIDGAGLSPREREVLQLIGEGHLSDDDLATTLFIAPSTAATHVQRVLRKTGLHSRNDLVLAANAPRLTRSRPATERASTPVVVRLGRAVTALRGGTPSTNGHGSGEQPAKGRPAGRAST